VSAPERFDRDATLGELLRALPRGQLPAALERSLGPHWEMLDLDGARALGPGLDGAAAAALEAPLRLGIDTLGRLRAAGPDAAQLAGAAGWVELALAGAERYRMASELHLESVHADYQALHVQHAALQQSEARYRALAAQLEQRVAAQTRAIEHAQRQFFHTEKMASVGTLAAGMAHEINNPIGFIRSNLGSAAQYVDNLAEALLAYRGGDAAAAQLAWRRHDIDAVLQDFPGLLAESAAGADRVAGIVHKLKAYASVECAGAVPADVAEAVRAVAALVAEQLPAGARLELDLAPLPALACDPGRVRQMLLALLDNARQALDGAGAGLIRVSGRVDGGAIRLVVEDDGCGVAPDIAARVFDPFFTTRDVGQGMGLGLTVARDIASAHGGSVALDSAGAGTRVTVALPLAGLAGAP
jgi:two-component system NtrC family sensor kinase